MSKLEGRRYPTFALSMAIFAVALMAACNLPFPRLTAIGPSGPPEKKEEKAPRPPAQSPCPTQNCREESSRAAAMPAAAKPAKKIVKTSPPPAPPVAEAPSPVGLRLSTLIARDQLQRLVAGHFVFDVAEQMRAGVREKVEVRFTEDLHDEFIKGLTELGMTNVEEIAAGSFLTAHLAGEGFEVTSPAGAEQSIGAGRAPVWSWEVRPLRSGVQPLVLAMTARVKLAGGADEKKELPVVTKGVAVASSPLYSVVRLMNAGGLWILGIVIATALAAGVLLRRGERKPRGRSAGQV